MRGHRVGRGFALGDTLSKAVGPISTPTTTPTSESVCQLILGAQVQSPFSSAGSRLRGRGRAGIPALGGLSQPVRKAWQHQPLSSPEAGSLGGNWSQETQGSVCVEGWGVGLGAGSPTSKWALGAAGG